MSADLTLERILRASPVLPVIAIDRLDQALTQRIGVSHR